MSHVNYYHLTKEALELTPVIVDLAIWSHNNLRKLNPNIGDYETLEHIKLNKEQYCKKLIEAYLKKIATIQKKTITANSTTPESTL